MKWIDSKPKNDTILMIKYKIAYDTLFEAQLISY